MSIIFIEISEKVQKSLITSLPAGRDDETITQMIHSLENLFNLF